MFRCATLCLKVTILYCTLKNLPKRVNLMIHVLTTSKILKIIFKRCETGSKKYVFAQMLSSIDRHEKMARVSITMQIKCALNISLWQMKVPVSLFRCGSLWERSFKSTLIGNVETCITICKMDSQWQFVYVSGNSNWGLVTTWGVGWGGSRKGGSTRGHECVYTYG